MTILLLLAAATFAWPLITFEVMPPDRRKLVMVAIQESLDAAHITAKEAYLTMGLDKHRWSRVCGGEEHLSIFRLAALPMTFQVEFVARYIFTVVRQCAADVVEDLRDKQRSA